MSLAFHIIIPARYHSTRFPGKLLMDIHGMSVLERVWRQAVKACPESVVIATDNQEIAKKASNFGAEVCMTDPEHPSGTDRVAEVVRLCQYPQDAVIVNLQGDEPFIDPRLIQQVAQLLSDSPAPVATLCWPIETIEQFLSPHVVKIVKNQHSKAMYFSRAPIPAHREDPTSLADCWRHIGLYAYRTDFLLRWSALASCAIEQHECLEQLRILYSGFLIEVAEAQVLPYQDINTPEDLVKARLHADVG